MSIAYAQVFDDDLLAGIPECHRKWRVTLYKSVRDIKPRSRTRDSLEGLLDLLEPVEVEAKESAPVIGFYEADGLRENAAVVAAHAFVFDLDGTDPDHGLDRYVEAEQIEALPCAHIYWPTWSSEPGCLRWRLVLPLDRPLAGEWVEGVSKRVLAWLRDRWPDTKIDDCSSRPSQPWFVPSYPAGGGHAIPHPVLNAEGEGLGVLSVADFLAEAMQAGDRRVYRRKYPSFRKGSRAQVPVFCPDPVLGAHIALEASTRLVEAQHACAHLQQAGIHVEKGQRQPTLNFLLWHLFRAGFTTDQIDIMSGEACERSGRDSAYLSAKLERLLLHYEQLEAEAEPHYWALASAVGGVWEKYRFSALHAARILSRHRGTRSGTGAGIDLQAVGQIVGLTPKALTKILGQWETAGVYQRSGAGKHRKHRIILPTTTKETPS